MANDVTPETARWFTRDEAAKLAGVSKDTLKRLEKKGQLHSRRRPGCPKNTVEYSYSALVDAGLCDPVVSPPEAQQALARITGEREDDELAVQLADAQARVESQQELLDALRVEVERLWDLTVQLAGGGR